MKIGVDGRKWKPFLKKKIKRKMRNLWDRAIETKKAN
jgi:hypothetical protein